MVYLNCSKKRAFSARPSRELRALCFDVQYQHRNDMQGRLTVPNKYGVNESFCFSLVAYLS